MSYESYVRSSRLNSLISRLDKKTYGDCDQSTLDLFVSVDESSKETLKNIGCNLESGYRYLTASDGNTLNDLCNYLNLWLDEKKSILGNDKFKVSTNEWQVFEDLWNTLMEGQTPDHKCKRKHEKKNISDYSKRKDLMSYCIIRDNYKRLCQSSRGSDNYNAHRCKGFSNYTQDNYNKLIKGINCIDKTNGIIDYNYHISDDCTLYHIPKTFPKCDEKTQAIVDVDNSKEDIKKCENIKQVLGATTELNAIPVRLDGDKDVVDEDDTGAMNILAVSAGRPDELKDSLSESIELALPLPTAVTSPNDKPSKPIYYAGLSTLGVIFTSTVLYKV
ncbi:hypothetical protein PVC01_000034600 [Plasmodium vivax]|uniref:VIR protein n=1 Tax=Plasmodium vivax TaxID=5855 RepID=A0A1G4E8U0_PLAVI|nr:hypothetical protein PVC01_000034600 [Plasmodium vivax]